MHVTLNTINVVVDFSWNELALTDWTSQICNVAILVTL